MSATTLEDAVLALVRERDYVSFAELQRELASAGPVRGDLALTLGHPNTILWPGLSPELCVVLEELLRAGRLVVEGCSRLVYVVDGELPVMRMGLRPPRGGYARPRWVPVVLRLPATRGRRGRPPGASGPSRRCDARGQQPCAGTECHGSTGNTATGGAR